MNKAEASKLLGVSLRTLENYLAKGRISARYVKGKTRDVADFDRAEVLRLKAELSAPQAHRGTLALESGREPMTPPPPHHETSLGRFSELRELAEVLRPAPAPAVALVDKLALPVAEAAELVSLSKKYLLAEIKAGRLKAAKRGRGWHIKRSDLEAWVKKL